MKWTQVATTDADQIRKWASVWPRAQFGWRLPLGTVVADVDDAEAFEATEAILAPTAGQTTPSGGYHRLYSGLDARQTVKVIDGLDTRVGGKGWVGLYAVDSFSGDVAPAPEWLLDIGSPADAGDHPVEDVVTTRHGITRLMGGWRRDGLGEKSILAELRDRFESGLIASSDSARPWLDTDFIVLAKEAAKWTPAEELPPVLEVIRSPKVAADVPAARLRHELAGDAILDASEAIESVWGTGDQSLWPRRESLMFVAPVGVGKTTMIQQVVLHGIGVREGPFLGLDVKLPPGVVGYVAADRPAQIKRSFRRMVTGADRELLNERMDIWSGALPFALDTAKTGVLADFVQARKWSTVILDSLKDLCSSTTDDEAGLHINQQIQECTARGIEVAVLHHQRKASGTNTKPRKLDDVFGSRWLTAGAGSVVMLWGEAGNPVVELVQLKMPADTVGPLNLVHDFHAGTTTMAGLLVKFAPTTSRSRVLAALPGTMEEVANEVNLNVRTVGEHLRALLADGKAVTDPVTRVNEAAIWRTVAPGDSGVGSVTGSVTGSAVLRHAESSNEKLDSIQSRTSDGPVTESSDGIPPKKIRRIP